MVEDENVDIYGYGFNDFYMAKKSDPIHIKNKQKINILITHGSLDSGIDENREYNPLTTKELRELGFDYVALGHIHKPDYVGKISYIQVRLFHLVLMNSETEDL